MMIATAVSAAMLMVVSVFAAEIANSENISTDQAIVASRLRNQDRMFALLMATYFEVQQDQIDRDYERRLKVISEETHDDLGLVVYAPSKLDKFLPNAYRTLVVKEHELRVARMARNITDLLDLYQSSRLVEQRQIGMIIPSAVDLETASKQVKRLLAGRMERPRDPRLWAEQETGVRQAAAPVERENRPIEEVSLQHLMDTKRKEEAAQTEPQRLGLVGVTLFGLPMLRTPVTSRP